MVVVIRRTSPHFHHVFQMGRPQIEPVASVRPQNKTPTSAAAAAVLSHQVDFFQSTAMLPIAFKVNADVGDHRDREVHVQQAYGVALASEQRLEVRAAVEHALVRRR